MTHVSTIKTNTQTMTPEALQEAIRNGSIDSTKITDVSVFNQSADPSACTDGKDDGKIGFFEAIGSTLKGAVEGVVNGIKGCFFDENGNFSLGNTLKTALTVGACFIPGVGPIIATGLCAYGAVKGGIGIAKGVAAAATAETDAEAKAAFESIGANGVATAASAVGLKASIGAVSAGAKAATGSSAFQNATTVGGKVAGLAKDALAGVKGYYGSAWGSATGTTAQKLGQVAKTTLKDTGSNAVAAAKAAKDAVKNKVDKITGKSGTISEAKMAKLAEKNNMTQSADGSYQTTSKDGLTTKQYNKVVADDGTVSYEIKTTKTPKSSTQTSYSADADGALTKTTSKTIQKSTLSDAQIEALKALDGKAAGSTKIKVEVTGDTVTITSTGKGTQFGKAIHDITSTGAGQYATYTNAAGDSVSTVAAGQPKAAAWTLASTTTRGAADNIEDQIPLASQQYATVDIQSGVEYDLEDYTIYGADQVNESYSQIMSDAYGL